MENTTLVTEQAAQEQIAPPIPTASEKELARFTKRRPKKKLIALLVVLAAAGGFFFWKSSQPKDLSIPVSTVALARGELVNMVNLSGTVESASSTKVYSNLGGSKVREVRVEEGTQVQAGQVMALMDTSDTELSIAQQRATMSQSEIQTALSLAADEKAYNDLLADIEAGRNSTLVGAQQAVDLAQRRFTDAGRDVTDHKDDMEYADDTMNQLERDLNKARVAKEKAEKAYKDAQRAFESAQSGGVTGEALAALQQARDAAQDAFNAADVTYDDSLRGWNKGNNDYGGDLTVWSKTYREARLNYQASLEDQEVAKQTVQRQLENLQTSIERARATSDMTAQEIALKKLQLNLQDAVITAPVSGTITAVYAEVGGPSNGLMFVIEDLASLKVNTLVREYDIAAVEPGMPVVIKSDATREQEFSGEVKYISPTAIKGANGETKEGGSVEFQADISLVGPQEGLRVGMNVRLNIILEKKENIFSVPYDAVTTNEEGQSIIYVMRPLVAAEGQKPEEVEGKFTAEPVVVTVGMETDFSVEISSAELKEADAVIADPIGLTPGAEVKVMPTGAAGMVG